MAIEMPFRILSTPSINHSLHGTFTAGERNSNRAIAAMIMSRSTVMSSRMIPRPTKCLRFDVSELVVTNNDVCLERAKQRA